jgi:hypothetical protein
MRQTEFKDRTYIYGEILNRGFIPKTGLILHGIRPQDPEGRVVRMHKSTVQKLRRFDAWKRGLILMTLYHDRPEVSCPDANLRMTA